MEVGFGTGDLHMLNLPLKGVVKFYSKIRADAVEINMNFYERLMNLKIDKELISELLNFKYISVHAPCSGLVYGKNPETENVLLKLRELASHLPVKAVIIHPSRVENFSVFDNVDLPILIENMDSKNNNFTMPAHFEKLKEEHNFNFVFDVEHAYENDHSMEMGKELIKVMGNKLKEMHVSGFDEKLGHKPVFLFENKKEIEKILNLKLKVPKILEGCFFENIEEVAKNELFYVRSFEN